MKYTPFVAFVFTLTLGWSSFASAQGIYSSTPHSSSSGREVIAPDLGAEDLYFYKDVLIDGVALPENVDATEGVSRVTLNGTGSLTLINKKANAEGSLRMTIFGGTEIQSRRVWQNNYIKTWWSGVLPGLEITRAPRIDDISFSGSADRSSRKIIYSTYGMGGDNEEFSFSQPVMVIFPVAKADGTKMLIAQKESLGSTSSERWSVDGNSFCYVQNGLCVTGLSRINSVALIEELFSQCPFQHSNVANGEFSGAPNCIIKCDRGFVLNDTFDGCVEGSKDSNLFFSEGSVYEVRPGTFRLTETRQQLDRYPDVEMAVQGLSPRDERLVRVQSAAARDTVRDETYDAEMRRQKLVQEGTLATEAKDDSDGGFLNYVLQIRNSLGLSPNVFSEETYVTEDSGELVLDEEGNPIPAEEDMYTSAPLLPSTGAGIFVTLIIIGIAVMFFARRRQI